MLKVVIIDDEPKAIQSLIWELENFCSDVQVLATFTNAVEAKRYLQLHEADCVFLDIKMPEMNGFQFLKFFPVRNFQVVITTAFGHYAIQAIKESALDYLLKPIDTDDLTACIEKVKSRLYANENIEELMKTVLQRSFNEKKISLHVNGKVYLINPDDIIYCESEGNYCTLYQENSQKILITQNLKFVEDKLPPAIFFRIHKSYLINLNKVKELHKAEELVIMTNGAKIPVSRQKKPGFMDRL